MIVCVLTNFFNHEGNQTVVNVDVASNLHNLGDVLVVEPQNFLVTILHEIVVECELDGFILLELNLSSATLKRESERERELVCSQDKNLSIKPSNNCL